MGKAPFTYTTREMEGQTETFDIVKATWEAYKRWGLAVDWPKNQSIEGEVVEE